jgi:hypothetical protein
MARGRAMKRQMLIDIKHDGRAMGVEPSRDITR